MDNRFNNKKSYITPFYCCLLLFAFICVYNNDVSMFTVGISFSMLSKLLVFGLGIIYIIYYKKITLNVFFCWLLIFIFYLFISSYWAKNTVLANKIVRNTFTTTVILIPLSMLIQDRRDLDKILIINYIAVLLCAIYVLFNVDFDTLGENRLDDISEEGNWNANSLGVKMCVGVFLSFYLFYSYKNKFIRTFALLSTFLFAYLILMTGSRTAFFMFVLFLIFIFVLKTRGIKKIFTILFIVALLLLVFYLVINYEPFYNVLGSRLEELFVGLFGEGTTEDSFNLRSTMIKKGWEFFLQKPFFGYGANNYSEEIEPIIGVAVYSHNNYIEMLVNGGFVGFCIFYFIYAYCIVSLLKTVFKKMDIQGIFLLVIIISMLIMHVSTIAYFSTIHIVFIMLATRYVKVKE